MNFIISVMTPFYNSISYINEYLKSHLYNENKINENVEFIFIDDCSNDNSFYYLEKKVKHPNYKIIRNKNNIGPGLTRLKGAKEDRGEFLIFLDIDDKINLEEKIKYQYKSMLLNNYRWSFTQFSINRKKQIPEDLIINNINQILRYRYIVMSSVMINKNLFLSYSYLLEKYSYSCEVNAIWINLALNKIFPLFINNITMIYNKSPNGLSANKIKKAFNVLRIYCNAIGLKKGIINFSYNIKNKL